MIPFVERGVGPACIVVGTRVEEGLGVVPCTATALAFWFVSGFWGGDADTSCAMARNDSQATRRMLLILIIHTLSRGAEPNGFGHLRGAS
jgi:hypothetical protein